MSIKPVKPLVSAVVFIRLTNGNAGRSKHWSGASKARKAIEKELRYDGLERKPFGFPVILKITRILGKGEKPWDSDSWQRGNLKELVDALVAVGWFVDDGPKWITKTEFEQDSNQRSIGPAVKIEVFRTGEIA